jgi:hypothetical protein
MRRGPHRIYRSTIQSIYMLRNKQGCLVCTQKIFTPSHQMFKHIYEVLNIDKKKLIIQFSWKPWYESFKPN